MTFNALSCKSQWLRRYELLQCTHGRMRPFTKFYRVKRQPCLHAASCVDSIFSWISQNVFRGEASYAHLNHYRLKRLRSDRIQFRFTRMRMDNLFSDLLNRRTLEENEVGHTFFLALNWVNVLHLAYALLRFSVIWYSLKPMWIGNHNFFFFFAKWYIRQAVLLGNNIWLDLIYGFIQQDFIEL